MTLGTVIPMGGSTPSVNYEIGQASTQQVAAGDRAVRNLANVGTTGAVPFSALQSKGSTVPAGIAVFSAALLRIYGWIDSGGWGALSFSSNTSAGGDPIAIDTRGGTNLKFLFSDIYGIFNYGTLTTTGSAYVLSISPFASGLSTNYIRNISFLGLSGFYGDVYAFSNPNVDGVQIISVANVTTAPLVWRYSNTAALMIPITWVEGDSPTSAYLTRAGSTTQKIGFVANINPGVTTPSISYFTNQGTDTYNGLAKSTANIFAAGNTIGLAQGWSPTGSTKLSDPANQVTPVGSGICEVNIANNVVFYSDGSTPFVHAWSYTSSAFGTKFANPATLPPGNASQIYVHPSDKAVCFIIGGIPYIYAWSNSTGFGALFTNPPEITGRNVAAFFNRSF